MEELPELTIKHLRAIGALSRCGKFTAAAAELGISQPGLSRIIQQAEDMLGVALFVRGTRSVVQTEAGRIFVPAAERALEELLQQVRNARALDGELRGQLVISSLMSISHHVLPAAFTAFRQRYPKIHIRLREGIQSGVQEDVQGGVADFGIGSPPAPRQGLTIQSVIEETCYAVLPRAHPFAAHSTVTLRDLSRDAFISMPIESGLRRLIDLAASAQGVTLDHRTVINQFQSLFGFVSSGLGIAIVPASALSPQNLPHLRICSLDPPIKRKIGFLRRIEKPMSAASEEFLGIFGPMFSEAARRDWPAS